MGRATTWTLALVLAGAAASGCGAPARPQPVQPVAQEPEEAEVAAPVQPPDQPPPVPEPTSPAPAVRGQIFLWCSQPAGQACDAIQRDFGLQAVPADQLPPSVLSGARDAEEDCTDPDLSKLLQRLARLLHIDPDNWHDNVGSIDSPDRVPMTFAGSGCTNCCWDRSEPSVKLHVVDVPGQDPQILMRVWEVGDA